MQKRARQLKLLELIAASSVGSQAELAELLQSSGHRVTQASISRDLDELGIEKDNGRYVRRSRERADSFDAVTFDTAGDNLIVGQCASGLASAITVRIDALSLPEIVGTIAGDDTIFIAVRSQADQRLLIERLRIFFG